MDIMSFVKSLLTTVNKTQLSDDVETAINLIDTVTMPLLNKATASLKGADVWAPENKVIIDFQKRAKFLTPNAPKTTNILEDSEVALRAFRVWLDWARKTVDAIKGEEIPSVGISYSRANLIRVIGLTRFMTRYITQIVVWALREENAARMGNTRVLGLTILKPEIEYLNSHLRDFCVGLNIGLGSREGLVREMDRLTDQVVSADNFELVKRAAGPGAVSFTGGDRLSYNLWPTYHIAMLIAEHNAKNVLLAKAELEEAELQLIAYREIQESGNTDIVLQRRIERIQNKITVLKKQIADMEE